MKVHEAIRQHIYEGLGMGKKRTIMPPPDELLKTQFHHEFVRLMENRMIMGAFRYGDVDGQDLSDYDFLSSIRKRLDLYEADGNREHLVDAANITGMAFRFDGHPLAHFKAIDRD